jgi:hypothetical protein
MVTWCSILSRLLPMTTECRKGYSIGRPDARFTQ